MVLGACAKSPLVIFSTVLVVQDAGGGHVARWQRVVTGPAYRSSEPAITDWTTTSTCTTLANHNTVIIISYTEELEPLSDDEGRASREACLATIDIVTTLLPNRSLSTPAVICLHQ